MGVYQICSNKSPWFKIDLGPGAYIQMSDFSAIMALLLEGLTLDGHVHLTF
jgi:hypothetical protein